MAKSTKLTYNEYKHLEGRLADFEEVTERTADEDAYRKTIILILDGRELRFVGPWVTYALKQAEREAKI